MTIKKFTRGKPCTKADIWNCFVEDAEFVAVPVALAKEYIGANVPRIMERNLKLEVMVEDGDEYYVLTEEGEEWLMKGVLSYKRNHPSTVLSCEAMLEELYEDA